MQTTSWFLVYLLGFAESAIAESDHRGSSAHLGSRCGFKRSSSGIGPWGSGAESEGPLVCEDRSRSALADCGCIGPDQPLPVIPAQTRIRSDCRSIALYRALCGELLRLGGCGQRPTTTEIELTIRSASPMRIPPNLRYKDRFAGNCVCMDLIPLLQRYGRRASVSWIAPERSGAATGGS